MKEVELWPVGVGDDAPTCGFDVTVNQHVERCLTQMYGGTEWPKGHERGMRRMLSAQLLLPGVSRETYEAVYPNAGSKFAHPSVAINELGVVDRKCVQSLKEARTADKALKRRHERLNLEMRVPVSFAGFLHTEQQYERVMDALERLDRQRVAKWHCNPNAGIERQRKMRASFVDLIAQMGEDKFCETVKGVLMVDHNLNQNMGEFSLLCRLPVGAKPSAVEDFAAKQLLVESPIAALAMSHDGGGWSGVHNEQRRIWTAAADDLVKAGASPMAAYRAIALPLEGTRRGRSLVLSSVLADARFALRSAAIARTLMPPGKRSELWRAAKPLREAISVAQYVGHQRELDPIDVGMGVPW